MLQLLNPDNAFSGANLILLLTLILLSTVFFICFSGYVKYNIVLNIIKNAVGTQQIPPTIVVNLLAALMALNSIWPDIKPGLERVKPYFIEQINGEINPDVLQSSSLFEDKKPEQVTMYYLVSNVFEFFPELLARAQRKTKELTEIIDIPLNFDSGSDTLKYFLGNLILDLYQGFEFGLKLYMIFVSIDFLIAVILSGVGMTMLSPTVISTPVKLAVFYFSDSWTILFRALQ
ncbi:EscR/YscR/HrcR family type III secretion system export apparatus protein [Shewanella baltica]|uniref:EscR/YscR/HrcR family type III secretion system export apparatus protein n=1 Tax=Shewanella baltica TaxID=62322 RepID=UPI0030D28F63